jgi:predicted metal-dependent hydrolase
MMRRVAALSLPAQRHVLGSGSMPDMAPLEAAKALAPSVMRHEDWQDNAAYLYGHDLLDAGFYWEAHEVWEAVWLACPPNSAEKLLLRMLIQQANARLKLVMGRRNAAERLAAEVEALRSDLAGRLDAPRSFMGVDISQKFAI